MFGKVHYQASLSLLSRYRGDMVNTRLGKVSLYLITMTIVFFLNAKLVLAENTDREVVNSVEVQLDISGAIYEGLQERIEYSIGQVGEKILLSRPISLLKENREAVELAIINIFSKVLTGFRLESVKLSIGNHTKTLIHITPIPPLISGVRVGLKAQGLSPEMLAYVNNISKKVEDELNRIFTGLPVASYSWSEGIFNQVADYILEREFPGFDNRFSIQPGEITEINIDLGEREPVVGETQIYYTAANIPVLFVKLMSHEYTRKFDILKGLPVEFVIQNQPRLEEFLIQYVNGFPSLKKTGMAVDLKIKPGVKTQIGLNVNSQVLLVNFDAGYYFNLTESYSNSHFFLGYHTRSFELFSIWPWWGKDGAGGNVSAGCKLPLGRNLTGGLEYEFERRYKSFIFHYQFDRGDYFILKFGFDHSAAEAVIGFKLNEQANLELIDNNNVYGIQVMFHF